MSMNTFELSSYVESCEAAIANAEKEIASIKQFLPYADGMAKTQDKQRIRQLESDLSRHQEEQKRLWAQYDAAIKQELTGRKVHVYLCMSTNELGSYRVYAVPPNDEHLAVMQIQHLATVDFCDLGISLDGIDFQKGRDESAKRLAEFKDSKLEHQPDELSKVA